MQGGPKESPIDSIRRKLFVDKLKGEPAADIIPWEGTLFCRRCFDHYERLYQLDPMPGGDFRLCCKCNKLIKMS
jgi:hypothetical protein